MFLANGFWLRDMNSKKIFIFKKGGCGCSKKPESLVKKHLGYLKD